MKTPETPTPDQPDNTLTRLATLEARHRQSPETPTPAAEEAARSAAEQIDACCGDEMWNQQDKRDARAIILTAFAPVLAERNKEVARLGKERDALFHGRTVDLSRYAAELRAENDALHAANRKTASCLAEWQKFARELGMVLGCCGITDDLLAKATALTDELAAALAEPLFSQRLVPKLIAERDQLLAWKKSAVAVEAEWDAQKIAALLGAKLGDSCRNVVNERVPLLVVERDAALAEIAKLREASFIFIEARKHDGYGMDDAEAAIHAALALTHPTL